MKLIVRTAFPPLLIALTVSLALAQTRSPADRARPPSPRAERLDGIAAVVNDDVVLESDVEEQLYLFLMKAQTRPDSSELDTLRLQVLNQLIDFKILVAEAKRLGISVTPSDAKDVDASVEGSMQDTKSRFDSPEAFQAQLRDENLTEAKLRDKYRSDLEHQILAERLVQKQLPKKTVTPAEAEAYFKQHPDKFPKLPAELKLQVIQIPPAADSAVDARAHARAAEGRKRILAGEKFAKIAAEISDDTNTARAGGDLGFLPRGALDRQLDDAVYSMKLNTLSLPLRSAVGWHLLEVIERDTLKTAAGQDSLDHLGKPIPEAHVRHILIRVPVGDDDVARARALARRVRAEALKGTDFATLVKRYSRYQGPAAADGDVGFVSTAGLQPTIRAGLDTVSVGNVSDVLENSAGFNVFKVNDRKPERAYELDEVRSELPDVVGQIQQRERYDEWVKGLRARAHVEIRGS